MPCKTFKTESGGGFVCSRGSAPVARGRACFVQGCPQGAFIQCDWPAEPGKTCDRWCCDRHAREVGPNLHHCLEHLFLKAKEPAR